MTVFDRASEVIRYLRQQAYSDDPPGDTPDIFPGKLPDWRSDGSYRALLVDCLKFVDPEYDLALGVALCNWSDPRTAIDIAKEAKTPENVVITIRMANRILKERDELTSIRFIRSFDILENRFLGRMDVLYGFGNLKK